MTQPAPARKLLIPKGGRRNFSVAGLVVEFASTLEEPFRFELPPPFALFESPKREVDLRVVVGLQGSLRPDGGRLVHDSGLNWRLRQEPGRTLFECYYPPTSAVLTTAAAGEDFGRYEILFDEAAWRWLWNSRGMRPSQEFSLQLPYPLDQLLLLPPLARREGFLLHASGAVVDGRAFVFAGHSGDGKTTLSAMLAAEGLEILSDERIALRKEKGTFMAYGTPWPGEGEVVAPAAYPLGGVFLLRKGTRHRVREGRACTLAAELLARSIVPYYFPEETGLILSLVQELVGFVSLRELEFSLEPGLVPLLARAA